MSNGTGPNAGGVRSLRAMFEQNQNQEPASSDVRGRSPATHSNGSDSRPMSKVRTSFVPVELVKKRNDTPEQGENVAQRRGSFSMDRNRPSDQEALNEIQKTVSQELALRRSNSSVTEVVPEEAIYSALPTPLPTATTETAPSITSTVKSEATSASHASTARTLDSPPIAPKAPIAKPVKVEASPKNAHQPSPRVLRNLAENLRTPRPAAQPEQSYFPPTPTPAPRTAEIKTPPTRVAAETPVQAEEQSVPAESSANLAKAGTERASRAKSRVASGTVTTGGFIKPKPKSPTRPIKLPAHLVAPTASSAAKKGEFSPPAPSRTISRRSSFMSTTSRVSSFRPSHPTARPKNPPAERSTATPAPRSPAAPSAPASFLERMMRPTASSASKVRERTSHGNLKK